MSPSRRRTRPRTRRRGRRSRRGPALTLGRLRRRGRRLLQRLVIGVIAVVVLAVLGTLLSGGSLPQPVWTDAPGADATIKPPVAALRHPDPGALPAVGVVRVVDGDTLIVEMGEDDARVRLYGISAPESDERCGPEATQRLEELSRDGVRLRSDARLQDRYGRELRYLYTPDGFSIDATLVAEGLAEAWTDDGALRDDLLLLEEEARAAGAGCLWGA